MTVAQAFQPFRHTYLFPGNGDLLVCYVTFVAKWFFYTVKYSEFYKLIEAKGWTIDKGTNHHKYRHPHYNYFIPVARHSSKEIPKGTLEKMKKDAGLK
jgi:predicted RNA binding protein YcfA (HicA-like mRNA interferase family)